MKKQRLVIYPWRTAALLVGVPFGIMGMGEAVSVILPLRFSSIAKELFLLFTALWVPTVILWLETKRPPFLVKGKPPETPTVSPEE